MENTFSLHEDAIVDLIEKYEVERAFITGHSLAGGMANVAHLIVRGQLKKEHSPWAKLDGKVTWLACTFAAPQTIVRTTSLRLNVSTSTTRKLTPSPVQSLWYVVYRACRRCTQQTSSIALHLILRHTKQKTD